MNFKLFIGFFSFILIRTEANGDDENLSKLLDAVRAALLSGGISGGPLPRGPQNYYYYTPSSAEGISLKVYEALRSITGNDDLECVPRLVCEAAAGGRPGFSGRQITQFDKPSLIRLMSYLDSGSIKSSPILTFAKAALLGVSNRGDPYSCIINYSKCPKDRSRLLHYLNNHRGGFFRYFDRNDYDYGNNYINHHHHHHNHSPRPFRRRPNTSKDYERNKISFGDFDLREKIRLATDEGVYAKKYAHSAFKFPLDNEKEECEGVCNGIKKRMVFPEGRILTKGTRIRDYQSPPNSNKNESNHFIFRPERFTKKLTESNFFPDEKREPFKKLGIFATSDRLPAKFHFPLKNDYAFGDYDPQSSNYLSENSFFPRN